jgi:hypothetical protein
MILSLLINHYTGLIVNSVPTATSLPSIGKLVK